MNSFIKLNKRVYTGNYYRALTLDLCTYLLLKVFVFRLLHDDDNDDNDDDNDDDDMYSVNIII